MTLTAENTGHRPFGFQALLHTYFKIPDVSAVSIHGLAGQRFVDKANGDEHTEEAQAVTLPSYTDRVYVGASTGDKDAAILSGNVKTAVSISRGWISTSGNQPSDIVVWNPYVEKSPGDLPPPAFREFVCVEPGLVSKVYDLAAGAHAELTQKILPAS